MKLYADNQNYKNFDVVLELNDDETELIVGLNNFCFGAFRIIMEMIDRCCETQEQASKLSELILDEITEYIKNYVEEFDNIRAQEKENEMYRLMEGMYEDWLNDIVYMTEDEFMCIFKNSEELHLKPIACDDGVKIYISNGEDEKFIIKIEKDTIKNDSEMLNTLCMVAYVIAIVIGDRIFGDDNNPIRSGDNEKVLAEHIKKMINE